MKFKTDQAFEKLVNDLKNDLIKGSLAASAAFIAYSFIIFKQFGGSFNWSYILAEILFVIILVWVQYSRIRSLCNTVNNTAAEISFINGQTVITTYAFNFFFIANKKQQQITFETQKIFLKKEPYPISRPLNDSAWIFAMKNFNIFVIPGYLPTHFTEEFLAQKNNPAAVN